MKNQAQLEGDKSLVDEDCRIERKGAEIGEDPHTEVAVDSHTDARAMVHREATRGEDAADLPVADHRAPP